MLGKCLLAVVGGDVCPLKVVRHVGEDHAAFAVAVDARHNGCREARRGVIDVAAVQAQAFAGSGDRDACERALETGQGTVVENFLPL